MSAHRTVNLSEKSQKVLEGIEMALQRSNQIQLCQMFLSRRVTVTYNNEQSKIDGKLVGFRDGPDLSLIIQDTGLKLTTIPYA